jgi:hypothetical protein
MENLYWHNLSKAKRYRYLFIFGEFSESEKRQQLDSPLSLDLKSGQKFQDELIDAQKRFRTQLLQKHPLSPIRKKTSTRTLFSRIRNILFSSWYPMYIFPA